MTKLLNRGLNFAILPIKLYLIEVHVDFKKFKMSTIWHELWHNREREDNNRQQVLENIKLIYLIYQILTDKNTYGEEIKYYEQVDHLALERSKNIIKKIPSGRSSF